MVRTRRTMTVLGVSTVLLLSTALGMWLGMVPQYEWDLFWARIQGEQVVSVEPSSSSQATLYVLDVDRSARQEVLVDLHLPGQGHGTDLASVPIWLTMGLGAVEMPLDDGLALRVELVPNAFSDERPAPRPPLLPGQIAQR